MVTTTIRTGMRRSAWTESSPLAMYTSMKPKDLIILKIILTFFTVFSHTSDENSLTWKKFQE
jgi:hypothetical protein